MKNHVFSQTSLGLNVVAIGGGNGLSTVLEGLKGYVGAEDASATWVRDLSAIVAVSDDGGSSGRLRDELNVLPPGDIRNCMVALSEDSHLLSKLFKYRFEGDGDLGGHSLETCFLLSSVILPVTLQRPFGYLRRFSQVRVRFFPATTADVRLVATLDDGETVRGETNVGQVGPRIINLELDPPTCHPVPGALDAIRNANLISIGPGSLYTSILPPLLVEDVSNSIAESSATKVFICNLMTQPGETEGYNALRHLEVVNKYAPQIEFDYVVVNNQPIKEEQAERYEDQALIKLVSLIQSILNQSKALN